jgi:hypothetical protein
MNPLCRVLHFFPAALILAAILLPRLPARAQVYERTIIHAGDSVSKYYTYLFPSFGDATVKLRDGRSLIYKMNFNLLLCDMQFINAKGDSLAISNPVEIDSILLDSCLFVYVYKRGYFQLLAVTDAVSLAVFRQCTFEPVQIGGMGTPRHSGGIEMFNSITSRQGTMPLLLNEDIFALKNTSFLFFYKGGGTENAGKAAFLRIFAGDKKSFDQFVKSNKIDYNKPGDLVKLFHFCTQSKM